MIDILLGTEVGQAVPVAETMHRLRHRVFKDRLGWDVPSEDGMERDQFDIASAVYFLAYDQADRMIGTWRVVPTAGPYMLRDVFPELLDGVSIPASAKLWEASRFAVEAGPGRASLAACSIATRELFCGLIEWCIGQGVDEVLTVYDSRIARLLPRIGCHPKWLSRTIPVGSGDAMAGLFDATPEVLQEIRQLAGITGSVLRRLPEEKRIAA